MYIHSSGLIADTPRCHASMVCVEKGGVLYTYIYTYIYIPSSLIADIPMCHASMVWVERGSV